MKPPSRNDAGASHVRKRRVIHVAGFDPLAPEGLERHMRSGLKRFGELWSATVTASEPVLAADGRTMDWQVRARGPNWICDTDYTLIRWDEVMAPYVQRSWLRRVLGGYGALFTLARQGMIGRFFRANLRYGLFVVYPLLLLCGFAILAVAAGFIAAAAGVPNAPILAPAIGVLLFLVLFRVLGSYFRLEFALSDWSFAGDLVHRRVAGLDRNIDRFASVLKDAVCQPDVDEVLVSATSLGAVLLAEALERALAADPDLCRRPPRFAMLTVGSSILKIGLHPAAESLRRTIARIGGEASLFWVEYQAKVDFINFYKSDPVALLSGKPTGRPIVRMVRIADLMGEAEYRRQWTNLLRVHRQFILPNGQRYFYDFYQICFGPMSLADRVEWGERAAEAFAPDGSYRRHWLAVIRRKALAAANK